jgi:hypothetical protein
MGWNAENQVVHLGSALGMVTTAGDVKVRIVVIDHGLPILRIRARHDGEMYGRTDNAYVTCLWMSGDDKDVLEQTKNQEKINELDACLAFGEGGIYAFKVLWTW